MQQTYIPLNMALAVGILWGLFLVGGVRWWDRQLKGEVFAMPETDRSSGGR
jgi:hypothetical protein